MTPAEREAAALHRCTLTSMAVVVGGAVPFVLLFTVHPGLAAAWALLVFAWLTR